MRIHLSLLAIAACAISFAQTDTAVLQAGAPVELNGVTAQGVDLCYDNTGNSGFTSGALPRYALDDAVLKAGCTAVNCINFGFVVSAGANTNFVALVEFWDTVNYGGGPLNSGALGSFQATFNNVAAGAFTTGLIDFSGLFTVNVPDGDLGVSIKFLDVTGALSTRVTHLFYGGGPSIGASLDEYARDVNNNGSFDAGENRWFGGPPNQANLYMQLGAVPEPSTYAAVATGLLGLLGLRRRK